jgi:hypothetical protein
MQAQTMQQQKSIPWIALLMAAIFAAAVVIGTQLVVSDHEKAPVAPAVQTVQTADVGVSQQKADMSKDGIHGLAAVGGAASWTTHRIRTPFDEGQADLAQAVLRSGGRDPALLATRARILAALGRGR